MLGILCEKPSAARNFAAALGGMKGRFDGEDYVICHALGHVVELVGPEANVSKELAGKYHSWSPDLLPWNVDDFKWKYKTKKGAEGIIKDIAKTLGPCDTVLISTDADPTGEGELLAWEAINAAGIKNKKWGRIYFEDESVKSIQKAFKKRVTIPSQAKDAEYLMALYRSKWDYMSMQFTRIATAYGDGKSILRQGRLKSAMVVLVGDQLKKVAEYKKIPSYSARFKDENSVVYIDKNQTEYPHREDVPMGGFHPSDVVLDKTTSKKTKPPKLLDLSSLSAKLAPRGLKPKVLLAIYQKMYEYVGVDVAGNRANGIVSYPRTEDAFVSEEQFNDLLPSIDAIAKVVGVDPNILTHRTKRKTHVKNGGAHGANRPGLVVPKSLTWLDSEFGKGAGLIYETLAKNYLAMLAEDYCYDHQDAHVKDFPTFKGSANIPTSLGWKLVYDDEEKDDQENEKGVGKNAKPYVHEGFPPKPQSPTVRWLMKQLEIGKDGSSIGTGATRVSTFSDVSSTKAKYPLMKENRGKLSMTDYGDMSYRLLKDTHIGDLTVTAKVMEQMKGVKEGSFSPAVGFAELAKYVTDDIKTMKANGLVMRKDLGIKTYDETPKEKVQGTLNNKQKFGKNNGKEISFNKVWAKHTFTDTEVGILLDGGEVEIHDAVSAKGDPMECKGELQHQQFRGRWFWGFKPTQWLQASEPPASWAKHKFTAQEKKKLKAGEHVEIKDGKSSKGRKLQCEVRWTKDEGIVPSFASNF